MKHLLTVLLGIGILFINMSVAQNAPKDTVITQGVKDKFANNKLLAGGNIEINTKGGIVYLSGEVMNEKQALAAIEVAQSSPQVNDVEIDKLVIKGGRKPNLDAVITAKIMGLFIQQKAFGESEEAAKIIHVETKQSNVSLSGKIDSKELADMAVEMAKSIPGVKQVNSTIEVIAH